MAQSRTRRPRGLRAFTMIEIAIAIGVIGFALVAIIGILPTGLNVQKDNREDTIINQDANFFMQAIRNGAVISNYPSFGELVPYAPSLDFLTNYVEGVEVTSVLNGAETVYDYTNRVGEGHPFFPLGGGLLGLLTTPHFLVGNLTTALSQNGFGQTNYVRAWVRGINGPATTQNGSNSVVAFRYIMDVQISPFVSFPTEVITSLTDASVSTNRLKNAQYLCHNLYEAQLTFHWPVLANGHPGPNHQTFRGLIAGHMITADPTAALYRYYVFQPHTFGTNVLQ